MIDKLCPIIGKKCIGKECEGHYIIQHPTCEIFKNKGNWKNCPANKHEFILAGKKIFEYTSNFRHILPGTQKHCVGCKFRMKDRYHRCAFGGGMLIYDETVKYSEE